MPSALFIGGTGLISSECVTLAVAQGFDVFLLNRGKRTPIPHTTSITADITQPQQVASALGNRTFDVVTNFIAFTPQDVARDIDLFAKRCKQYILVSSCACYQKPPRHYLVNENTPLDNPFWPYAQQKIAAENLLTAAHQQKQINATIARPSLTYGISRIPAAYHNSTHSWTTAYRFLSGKPVIVHGDGTSLWQITHAADFAKGFVGLMNNPAAFGQAYNITTDEVLTWNDILNTQAQLLGVKPNILHIPTDFIAKFDPARAEGLYGDKTHSIVIDNSKIKALLPTFKATIPFKDGLAQTLAWFKADPARQTLDHAYNATADRIIAAYTSAFPA